MVVKMPFFYPMLNFKSLKPINVNQFPKNQLDRDLLKQKKAIEPKHLLLHNSLCY